MSDSADRHFECRICWYVYDPAVGDEIAQVPPGVGFDRLPDDWCCPGCEAGKEKFLPCPD